MSRTFTQEQPMMTALAEAGSGNVINVEDFEHIVISVDTGDSAELVLNIQGAIQDTLPTWGDSQSATNRWDYLQIKDLEDGSSIDGDTGITFSGTDDHRIFEVNVNGLKWINAIISSVNAGNITIKAKCFSPAK